MISALTLLGALLAQGPQIEWVVRDVVPPRYLSDEYISVLGPTWPFGKSAHEGFANRVVENLFEPDWASGLLERLDLNYFSGIGPPAVRDIHNRVLTTAGGTWATLATPTGSQVLMTRASVGLVSIDPATEQLIGTVTLPTNLPNGALDPDWMYSLYAAGDINGDGYDDCFWTDSTANLWVHFGLLDGATLTSSWVTSFAYPNSSVNPPSFWEPEILPDLDGDGHADFFVGRSIFLGIGAGSEHTWYLISGIDGSVIWSQQGVDGTGIRGPYGRDLSNDGSPDAVVQEGQLLRGISARDGVELWRSSLSQVWNTAGPGEYVSNSSVMEEFTFSHALAATGNDSVIYPIGLAVIAGTPIEQRSGFGHFDAVDGTFLGAFYAPQHLRPWSQDSFSRRILIAIGDYDRDGLTEWYARDPDPANTPAWALANNQFTERMVILGQRTLFVPSTHDINSYNFQLDVAIPSAPNKEYLLLFSTEFDAESGLEFENWRTQLGASRILDFTLQRRYYSGTLDVDGQLSTTITVPPSPQLLGRTLFSRAMVLNPPGSQEKIWTMSSLGVTEIQ